MVFPAREDVFDMGQDFFEMLFLLSCCLVRTNVTISDEHHYVFH